MQRCSPGHNLVGVRTGPVLYIAKYERTVCAHVDTCTRSIREEPGPFSLFLFPFLFPSLFPSLSLSLSLYLSLLCVCVCVCLCLSVCLSLCLSVCLSVALSVSLSVSFETSALGINLLVCRYDCALALHAIFLTVFSVATHARTHARVRWRRYTWKPSIDVNGGTAPASAWSEHNVEFIPMVWSDGYVGGR